jgi:predicted ATPase
MEQGFRDFISKHGGKVTHSVYCVMRAEALQRAGHDDAALLAVEMGLEVALECAEHCYVPELHRLRAELLASSGAARIDIDKAYSEAIDTSQAQGQDALRRRSEASRARYLETVGEPSTEWQ